MKHLLLVFVIFCGYFASAQFNLSGEMRPRTEFNHGYKTLATENQDWAALTTQRTRLNLLFKSEVLKTALVFQDVRLWGSQPQMVTNEDFAVSIHEAWGEVKLAKNFWLKAGRQELAYDDQRILGSVGWIQQGRSHDVAVLKIEDKIKIHFGIAHQQSADITRNYYAGPDAYKNMQFLWLNKVFGKSSISFLVLNNGVPVNEKSEQITKYGQTLGTRFSQGFKGGSISTNLYFQTGKHSNGKDISAMNFLLEASLKKGITVGYEYLSGNSFDKNDKVYAFTPLYGTNHKFNGFMDYFYVGNHINSVGLHDSYLKYNVAKNKVAFNADLHYFISAGLVKQDAKKYLGTELDLTFTYKVHETASISAGWSTLFAGEGMKTLKGISNPSDNHWAYLMLSITPIFIK